MLDYVYQRFHEMKNKRGLIEQAQRPLECERKFMDFLRVIIEGGWVVETGEEWIGVLEFLEIEEEIRRIDQAK